MNACGTLDNVLYWSLAQQKAIKAVPQWIDLREIIEEVTADLQGLVLVKDIDLVAKESLAHIKADEQLLAIVLRNILHNAIKFTPEGGIIEIEIISDSTGTQIRIKDNGPGFEVGENRGKKSLKQGTGIGLNLSRELMRRNGGELKISSQLNMGTTVVLFWGS